MFEQYLQENEPELLASAKVYDIDLSTMDGIYQLNTRAALQFLRKVVADKERDKPSVNYVARFVEDNQKLIAQYYDLQSKLLLALKDFNDIHNVSLYLDYDAQSQDTMIQRGRAKYGSRKRIERDLTSFVRVAKDTGYSMDVRISPSSNEPYVTAQMSEEGFTYNGTIYPTPRELQRAVRSGSTAGSPWKSIQIRTPKGDWITLDRAFNSITGEETEDDTEDHLEEETQGAQ